MENILRDSGSYDAADSFLFILFFTRVFIFYFISLSLFFQSDEVFSSIYIKTAKCSKDICFTGNENFPRQIQFKKKIKKKTRLLKILFFTWYKNSHKFKKNLLVGTFMIYFILFFEGDEKRQVQWLVLIFNNWIH